MVFVDGVTTDQPPAPTAAVSEQPAVQYSIWYEVTGLPPELAGGDQLRVTD